mgnify:CR=1 FL=1
MYSDFVPNLLVGRVRGRSRPEYGEGDERLSLANGGEACIAFGLPPKAEIVRLGGSWSVATPSANAFAPVAAYPTTLANIVLYNGYSSTGPCLVIDTIGALAITSIAAASSITLLAQISHVGVAAPTDNTAALISSRTGAAYGGKVKRAIANSAFAVADKWEIIGESSGHPSTAIGAGAFAEVAGGWIVPPGATLCVNLVASTAAGTMIQTISWHELVLNL